MTSARRPISSHHFDDEDGNPAGGVTYGEGFAIGWQNGPTRPAGSTEPVRTGAFVEEVILACRDRIDYYQRSRFACQDNAEATRCLDESLAFLYHRTAEREARGVEGTHSV